MKKISCELLVLFILLVAACRGRDSGGDSGEYSGSTSTSEYEEGDIIRIRPLPPDLREWIGFYASIDTAFTLNNFRASGVAIHFDSMPNALSQTNEAVYKSVLAYSPDSTHFIDFFSYNQHIEKVGTQWYAYAGDPEQEIKLVDKKRNLDKQLMYYGPSQAVEAAAWLNNSDFMLGIMNLNDSSTAWLPEIYLFNLNDSTFTNFRFTKTISVDSVVLKNKNFFEAFFKKRNILMR